MSFDAVVFDLDYTLAVPERDRQALLDEATEATGVHRIDRTDYLDAHAEDLASETRTPIFEAVLRGGDPEGVASAYREAVEDALVPVFDVPALVADLRPKYRVGLLTDGPARAQYGKLEALGWEGLFDAVVVTGELPAGKPDRRTFETISDRLDVDPARVLYVGDHPVADVEGASAAGMTVYQIESDRYDPNPEADRYVPRDALEETLRERLLCDSSAGDHSARSSR